jgi:hypothetical protein
MVDGCDEVVGVGLKDHVVDLTKFGADRGVGRHCWESWDAGYVIFGRDASARVFFLLIQVEDKNQKSSAKSIFKTSNHQAHVGIKLR